MGGGVVAFGGPLVDDVAAGVAAGALLGGLGTLLSAEVRLASASVLAILAAVVGTIELSGRRLWLLQYNHETPQSWVHLGPVRWATLNGIALGLGGASRIGFWLWYVVPLGALLFASPILGAIIFGTYSLVRGMLVWALISASRTFGKDYVLWLLERKSAARFMAASQLVLLGVTVVIVVGL